MTTIKDPIRQASLFTPFGLIDPRLMPGYEKPRVTKKAVEANKGTTLREIIGSLLRSKFGFQ